MKRSAKKKTKTTKEQNVCPCACVPRPVRKRRQPTYTPYTTPQFYAAMPFPTTNFQEDNVRRVVQEEFKRYLEPPPVVPEQPQPLQQTQSVQTEGYVGGFIDELPAKESGGFEDPNAQPPTARISTPGDSDFLNVGEFTYEQFSLPSSTTFSLPDSGFESLLSIQDTEPSIDLPPDQEEFEAETYGEILREKVRQQKEGGYTQGSTRVARSEAGFSSSTAIQPQSSFGGSSLPPARTLTELRGIIQSEQERIKQIMAEPSETGYL